MARARSAPPDPVAARLDEIARLLAVAIKHDRGLQEAIVEVCGVGISQARAAELLGTSGSYVNVALSRAKKQAKKKAASPKRA